MKYITYQRERSRSTLEGTIIALDACRYTRSFLASCQTDSMGQEIGVDWVDGPVRDPDGKLTGPYNEGCLACKGCGGLR